MKKIIYIIFILIAIWVSTLRLFEVIFSMGMLSKSSFYLDNLIIEIIPNILSVFFCFFTTYSIIDKYRKL